LLEKWISSAACNLLCAGHKRVIELLRGAGASETIKNNKGRTAPDVAAAYGKAKL
jgi:hypothetical protein